MKSDAGDMPGAVEIWEQLVAVDAAARPSGGRPPRDAYTAAGRADAFEHLFRRLIAIIRRTGAHGWRFRAISCARTAPEDALQMALRR